MRLKNMVTVLFATFLLPVAVARAEGPQPGQAGYVDPQYQQQNQQQVIADPNAQYQQQPQQGPAVAEQSSNEQAQAGRGIEYGLYLTVPIFVTNPTGSDVISTSPGIGIIGRVGWEFGSGFAAELNLGVQWNGMSGELLGVTVSGSFTNVFAGAGIRYSFLNPSALVPFVGAGLQLNFWGADTGSGSGTSTTNDHLALGVNALVGLAYEVSADLALEAGLRTDFTTQGKDDAGNPFFDGGQVYLSPFIGGTLYY